MPCCLHSNHAVTRSQLHNAHILSTFSLSGGKAGPKGIAGLQAAKRWCPEAWLGGAQGRRLQNEGDCGVLVGGFGGNQASRRGGRLAAQVCAPVWPFLLASVRQAGHGA